MSDDETRTEAPTTDTAPAEKRPWVTPEATVEDASEVTQVTDFTGILNDGASLCSS